MCGAFLCPFFCLPATAAYVAARCARAGCAATATACGGCTVCGSIGARRTAEVAAASYADRAGAVGAHTVILWLCRLWLRAGDDFAVMAVCPVMWGHMRCGVRGCMRCGGDDSAAAWVHAAEEMSACISAGNRARSVVVEAVSAIAVVVIDTEVPASVHEDDGAVKVAVTQNAVPQASAEQRAQGQVAGFTHSHVVIVVVAECHIVEVVVHAPNVVVVDAVNLVDEIRVVDAQGICHAVGQEPCIALDGNGTHALSIHGHGSGEEHDCCEESS